MANEELILTDDLNKLLVELDKNSKSLSSSTKKLSSDSEELTKSFSSLSKEVRDVFKGMATGDLDKVIKKLEETKKYNELLQESFKNEKGWESEVAKASEYTQVLSNLITKLKEVNDTPRKGFDIKELHQEYWKGETPDSLRYKAHWQSLERMQKLEQEEAERRRYRERDESNIEAQKIRIREEAIRKEQQDDKQRLNDWLANKHFEEKEHKRIEDEKFNTTKANIEKQNKLREEAIQKEIELENRKKANQQKQQEWNKKQELSKQQQEYDRNTSTAGALYFSSNAKTYQEQEQAIKYLTTARGNLSKTDSNYEQTLRRLNDEIERNKREMKNATKSSSDLAREEEQARIQQEKAYQQRRKRILAERELVHKQINESYDGSLRFSDNAKTINDRAKAIENMRKAYNKLDPSVETNKVKMARLNLEIKKQESALRRLQGETAKTSNAMGQWASRLGALFGINAISNFVRKMVTVRGEFELQQKSLEVLLKSKTEANKLWDDTVNLAVKSPFQIEQLISYTKQLAAYQIEQDKLHDTTKRLADLSAGLGVDMGRLILAYGQVRTAEYLRATEVRQFTEAGVPLLDALADRFTALEGKAVSVAEVMERITKRQVTFGDVEAVINQMTDLGGLFYNMQEEQSKTIKGMMSNLKDEISLMFNEIGESSEGAIKRLLQVVRWLVKNWEVFANILTAIVPLYGIHKLGQLRFNESLMALAHSYEVAGIAGRKYLKVSQLIELTTKRLKKAFDSLKTALMKHPIIAIATLVVGGIVNAIFSIEKFNDTLNEITDNTITKIDELNNKKIDIIDTKDLDEKRKKLAELVNIAKTYQIEINFKINELSISQINEKANEISNQIKVSLQAIEAFDKAVAEQEYETGGGWSGLGMFEEEMHEDVKDLRDDLLDLNTQMGKLPASARTTGELFSKSFSEIVEQSGSAEKAIKKMRGELLILRQDGKINIFDQMAMNKDLSDLESSIKEFKREVDEILDNLNEDGFEILTNEEKIRRLNLVINAKADWNEFEKDLAKAEAEKKYGIKLRLTLEESAQKKLQDDLNTLYTSMENATSVNVKEVEKEFDATLKKTKERTESLFNLRKSSITEMIELEKRLRNGGIPGKEYEKLELLRKENSEYIRQKEALDLLDNYKGDGFKQFLLDVRDGVLTNNNLLDEFYNSLLNIEGLIKSPKRGSINNILSKDVETIAQNLKIPKDQTWNFGGIKKEIKPVGKLVEELNTELSKGISHTEAILNLFKKYKGEVEASRSLYYTYQSNLSMTDNEDWVNSRKDYNEDSAILKILIELAKQYNVETQKSGGRKAESIVPKQIEEIKKAFEEWDKLNDYWDNTLSATRVVDAMTESLGALNVELGKQDGFLTFNGQIVRTKRELAKLLGSMANKANKKDKRLFLQAQASLQVEFDQDDAKREFEKVIKEIDDQIAGYELFSELKDLNVGIDIGELAKMFGVETKSLEDIKKGLEEQLKALPAGNEEEHKKIVEKINQVEEMQDKERVKRLKDYTKMLEKTMDDNLKVHYDYYKQLGQIEQDREKGVITENFANALKNQLGQQYKEQKDKVAWEDFTGSDYYIQMFEDLENASKTSLSIMLTKLRELKDSLKDLPPDQLKEIVDAIEKIEDEQKNRKGAFAGMGENIMTVVKGLKDRKKLEEDLAKETELRDEQQERFDKASLELGRLKAIPTEKLTDEVEETLKIAQENYDIEKKELDIQNAIVSSREEEIGTIREANKELGEQLELASQIGQSALDITNTLGEAFGADSDILTSISEIGGGLMNTVSGLGQVIASGGLNPMAWIELAKGLADTVASIAGASDRSKQREIEDLQEHIDSLAKSYEELSEAMDMAYSMDRMSSAYRMAQATIESQKKAIKEQIKLEKEKWNTDEEKVKEYEEQLEELDKQSEDLKQQLIDSMGGITDTNSKAREFVDAWVDAFKETGDGLSGLEQNFDEFFDNLIREQISKQVIGSITDKFAKEVEKAILEGGDSGEITEAEWRQLQQSANASKEQMNNAMQMYRQFFEESGAGLSSLQEGIKGITESQADIIASYLNSIRMFVSEKTSYAREIRDVLKGINGQPNPMLDELKRVARHTENIRDLLLKVSDPISNTLKVSIYQ